MGTVPTVPAFPAGQVVTSSALNTLGTAITWCLSGKPVCQVQQKTGQSFANTTSAPMTWDTNVENRDSMWSSGSNSRLTCQTPGIFLIAASINWTANATGTRFMYFQVTTGSNNPAGAGVTIPFGFSEVNNAGAVTSSCNSEFLTPYLYVNDYVQVLGQQNSGGALSTQPLPASGGPPWCSISLVSG